MASATLSLLLLPFFFTCSIASESSTAPKVVDVERPVLEFTPMPFVGSSKDVAKCARVQVAGISRLKLGNLHGVYRVALVPSVVIPEKLHSRIQICSHRNSSVGSCQCEKDDWGTLHKGVWSAVLSPYEDSYIDVKFTGDISGSVTITLELEFQRWRLFAVALGFILLLLAPIVSSWVPFYYSSSMVVGILLVVIILLFQGMKLLPTGRKNAFYLTIYGSLLGAGSFLLHQLSVMVNSILLSFGLSEDMHSSVSILLLLLIVLVGAGFGCWLVRKFVVSEDGSVDVGVAQFVKWAIRTIAVTAIFQGTYDTPLAMALVCSCITVSILATSFTWPSPSELSSYSGERNLWLRSHRKSNLKRQRAEFYSPSWKTGSPGTPWGSSSPNSPPGWSNPKSKGMITPSPVKERRDQRDFYSTFHTTPQRKKFTEKEWDSFTKESTRQAVAELSASPEFTDWVVKNANRIKVSTQSSDESLGSGEGSSDETALESTSGVGGLYKWQSRR